MESLIVLRGSIALLLKFFTICIHSFGLYLLHCLVKNGKGNVQMVYIMNLSATELIINICSFSRNFVRMIPAFDSFRSSHTYNDIEMYSYILDYQLKFCLYMWMLYITIDRVCGVLLNFKYSNFWGTTKAKILVGLTWLLAVIALVYILVTYIQNEHEESHIRVSQLFETANCFVMVFDFSFVATSVAAYLFIFCKYKQSQERSYLHKSELDSTKNVWKIFRHSRFYVSVLLISTYIVFTIIPDLLWTFEVVRQYNIEYLMTIMYASSHLADGIIYIFMHDRVKRMLYKKLNKLPFFKQKWQLLVKSRSVTSEWSTESVLSRRMKFEDGGRDGSITVKGRGYSAVSTASREGSITQKGRGYSAVSPASRDGSISCKSRGYSAVSTTSREGSITPKSRGFSAVSTASSFAVATASAVASSSILSASAESSTTISSSLIPYTDNEHSSTDLVVASLENLESILNDGPETNL